MKMAIKTDKKRRGSSFWVVAIPRVMITDRQSFKPRALDSMTNSVSQSFGWSVTRSFLTLMDGFRVTAPVQMLDRLSLLLPNRLAIRLVSGLVCLYSLFLTCLSRVLSSSCPVPPSQISFIIISKVYKFSISRIFFELCVHYWIG